MRRPGDDVDDRHVLLRLPRRGGARPFWSRVLERPVDYGATAAYATIGFDAEGPTWMFVRSEELPEGRNRLMLDLGGEADWLQEADRVEELGARRIADHEMDGVRWVELRDPEDNTFRIFAPRPA